VAAAKPSGPKNPPPPGSPAKSSLTAGVLAVTATAALVGIGPFVQGVTVYRNGNIGLVALLILIGVSNLALTVYAFRKDVRTWGGLLITDVFLILIAVPLGEWWLVALVVASLVCLAVFRLDYGVGAYRLELAGEEKDRAELERVSLRNPTGATCRTCGKTTLWISSDGSAVCMNCKTGMTRAVGVFPAAAGAPPPPPP